MLRREFIRISSGLVVSALGWTRVYGETEKPRVLIVGGGILGASFAYHLAQRGAQVTLCEKNKPASAVTRHSFAWINATFSKQPYAYFNLNQLGIAAWRRLQRELDGRLDVQWGGALEWYPAGLKAEQLLKDVRRHQGWGYGVHRVDEVELRGLLPGLVPGACAAAAFSEPEGTVDPVKAALLMLEAAQRLGAKVFSACEVTGLELERGRVRQVLSSQGPLDADIVVVASGNDTPRVAAMAGVKVPLKNDTSLIVHLKAQPRLLERIVTAPTSAIKQNPDGRVVTEINIENGPAHPAGDEPGRFIVDEAARYLPPLKGAAIENVFLCHRVMPLDEYPIVGFTPSCPNLYVAATHSGVTLGPLLGELATLEILDAAEVELLQPYRPSRFK